MALKFACFCDQLQNPHLIHEEALYFAGSVNHANDFDSLTHESVEHEVAVESWYGPAAYPIELRHIVLHWRARLPARDGAVSRKPQRQIDALLLGIIVGSFVDIRVSPGKDADKVIYSVIAGSLLLSESKRLLVSNS